jgi:hypothetical protein
MTPLGPVIPYKMPVYPGALLVDGDTGITRKRTKTLMRPLQFKVAIVTNIVEARQRNLSSQHSYKPLHCYRAGVAGAATAAGQLP